MISSAVFARSVFFSLLSSPKNINQSTGLSSSIRVGKYSIKSFSEMLSIYGMQEEYVDGDEVGTMPCEHMYHVSCVQQWLRMKNWCRICKTSAEEKMS